jgi:methyltransferase (TIGR00027 family)
MRTDDDTWDIATSVGATALGVAAARAAETRQPDALFRDPFAEVFTAAAGAPQWHENPDEEAQRALRLMRDFIAARTKFFDDSFAQATAQGVRQVVILAAGLDARAYRLPWPDGTVVFELDQPKVLEFKHETLAARGAAPTAERREVAADLRHDWPAALAQAGFDRSSPTAWLAEGLLLYLPGTAQDALFENIVAHSAPGSWFATNISVNEGEHMASASSNRTAALALDSLGSDVKDLRYPDDERSRPADWFAGQGWQSTSISIPQQLLRLGRPLPDDLAEHMSEQFLETATLVPQQGRL